jgi:hypothetical protein
LTILIFWGFSKEAKITFPPESPKTTLSSSPVKLRE